MADTPRCQSHTFSYFSDPQQYCSPEPGISPAGGLKMEKSGNGIMAGGLKMRKSGNGIMAVQGAKWFIRRIV